MFEFTQLAKNLWQGSRMESRSKESSDRFAMATNRHWPQSIGAIGEVEPPVLFQFPNGETEKAGQEQHVEPCDRTGERRAKILPQEMNHVPLKHDECRQEDLVRYSHYGKVLDRMKCRLNQQIHVDPNQEGDERPDHTQYRFGNHR